MCVGFIWAKASRWDDAGSTCGASLKDMSAARVARQVLCQSLERKKAGTKPDSQKDRCLLWHERLEHGHNGSYPFCRATKLTLSSNRDRFAYGDAATKNDDESRT